MSTPDRPALSGADEEALLAVTKTAPQHDRSAPDDADTWLIENS